MFCYRNTKHMRREIHIRITHVNTQRLIVPSQRRQGRRTSQKSSPVPEGGKCFIIIIVIILPPFSAPSEFHNSTCTGMHALCSKSHIISHIRWTCGALGLLGLLGFNAVPCNLNLLSMIDWRRRRKKSLRCDGLVGSLCHSFKGPRTRRPEPVKYQYDTCPSGPIRRRNR